MKRRKRRGKKEWEIIIGEQEASGLTAYAFCRKHSLGAESFYRWRKRLSKNPRNKVESKKEEEVFISMGQFNGLGFEGSGNQTKGLTVIVELGDGQKITLRRS
jgi:transposase-like protein